MTLADKIFCCFKECSSFSLKEAYEQNADKPQETVRARIYEKIGSKFERVAKGVYRTIGNENEQCVILSILVYTLFSRMFDLMQPPVVKHSIVVA